MEQKFSNLDRVMGALLAAVFIFIGCDKPDSDDSIDEKNSRSRIYGNIVNSYNTLDVVSRATVEYGVHYVIGSVDYYDLVERVILPQNVSNYEFLNVKADLSDYEHREFYRHYVKVSAAGFHEKIEYIKIEEGREANINIVVVPLILFEISGRVLHNGSSGVNDGEVYQTGEKIPVHIFNGHLIDMNDIFKF